MTHGEIEAFLAVCEQRNITRAAEVLYIGQSTLSTKLKLLEKEIGCELIVRNKGIREIQLTPEGEAFYALACQYRDVVDKMMQIGQREEKKVLRVASINSLGTHVLPPVYELFMQLHPDVELEIQDKTTGDAFFTLERGLTDIAFGPGTRTSEAISLRPVFSEKMMIISSAGMGFPQNVPKEKLRLEKEIYIGWSLPYRAWHTAFFGDRIKPQIRLELMNQLEFFLDKSDCWAIVPYSVARMLEGCESIRCSEPDFFIPPRVTNFLYRTSEEDSLLAADFLSCLKEWIQTLKNDKITCLL